MPRALSLERRGGSRHVEHWSGDETFPRRRSHPRVAKKTPTLRRRRAGPRLVGKAAGKKSAAADSRMEFVPSDHQRRLLSLRRETVRSARRDRTAAGGERKDSPAQAGEKI